MPTVREILGDEFATLKGQGKSNDEIIAIAKDRYKNPPQQQSTQIKQEHKPKPLPEWYRGETDNGLINFGADVLRGAGATGLGYLNVLQKVTGADTSKTTKMLQRLEKITQEHKAVDRTPERQAEIIKLNKENGDAQTFGEKFKAGFDTVIDTVSHPKEWQVGEFIGENLDPINVIPGGKGIVGGATIGAMVNGVQTGGFAASRSDKSTLDALTETALGAAGGAVLGGVTGGLTKERPQVSNESNYDAAYDDLGVNNKIYDVEMVDDKVDNNGMLLNPFEKKKIGQKVYHGFAAVINDAEARAKNVDAEVKQIGHEMSAAGATSEQIEQVVAAKLLPTPESKAITAIINDGKPVTPRLEGLNLQQAVINSIKDPSQTPTQFYANMIKHGFVPEIAKAATNAYESKDISLLSVPLHDKLLANVDKLIDVKKIAGDIKKDNSYELAHEALPVEHSRSDTQQSALFGNEQQLFDVPSTTKLKVPAWAKPLVSDTVKYEDIVRDITNAKNGGKPTALAKRAMMAQAKDELKSLKKDERINEVLDMTRENDGANSPQRLESSKKVKTTNAPDGYHTVIDKAAYSKNYQYDFALTKARVKRIESGKPTLQDIEYLKADLDMIKNNPLYALPTQEELKTKYEELAANPERIYDTQEFDRLQQRFDPETYAEKQELFGETTQEELENDTSYTRSLARDSQNAAVKDTIDERAHANERGADRTGVAQAAQADGTVALSRESDNSTPGNTSIVPGKQSNTQLHNREAAAADDAGTTTDKNTARSGGDDGANIQTQQRAEASTGTESQQKQKQSGNDGVERSNSNITDFGEKIGGARKDLFAGSKVDISKFNDFTANELFKTIKKNKVFKAIDYRELAGSFDADKLYALTPDLFDIMGIVPDKAPLLIAHFVKTIKDSIQTPKNGWSADKFKSYVEGIEIVKNYLSAVNGMDDFKNIRTAMFGSDIVDGRYINAQAKHYAAYSALGSKFNSALSFSSYDIRKSARAIKNGWMSEGANKSTSSKFDVGQDVTTGEFFVSRKNATWHGNLVADGFKTEDDAINFINSYEKQEKFRIYKRGDGYEIGRRYADGRYAKLKDGLKTEVDARKYLVDNIDMLEKMKGDDIAKREIVDTMTYGQDHRGGIDVTPDKFNETFGFRGIEFGNWNSQAERQLNLNRAYDSLSDLADLLGIPQRAISLNGELSLAFGARGRGGKQAASAHYEPDRVVINLTKKAGAGSLAHEWAHALDNYFGKKANSEFLSESYKSGDVRADLYAMYKEVIFSAKKIDGVETNFYKETKELDKSRSKQYWSTTREIFARVFEAYVGDRLKENGIHNSYLVSGENNPHAYPIGEERVVINNALYKMQQEMKYRAKDESVELYADVIPGIRKVVSFFENWDEKVDLVYDGISNYLRGVDSDGNLKPKEPSNNKIINFAKNLGELMQENFILGGARSDKLINMLNSLNNHKSTIVNDAVRMREALEHLSKNDNQDLVRALGGDMDLSELNAKLRPIYDKFRRMIDENTDALVAAEALDPKYVRENYIKRYYFDNLKDNDFFAIFKGGIANTKRFKRKEMSLADRIAKGQIEDAGYVVAKTILEQRDQLLKAKFFQTLADTYGVDKMQDGYVEIPDVRFDGGVKKFGALNGKYVPYEVYQSIRSSSKFKEELSGIEKTANYWVKSVQHIKTNMTVKNAGTHLYNVLSNGYIAYLDGHYTQLGRILSDKNYYDLLKTEASRFGLDTMLDDMEAQFFKEHNPDEGALMKLYKNAYLAEGSKLGDAARKAYEFEDVAFKLAAYAKRRESLQLSKYLSENPGIKAEHERGLINEYLISNKYQKDIRNISLSEAELEAVFKGVDEIYVNYGTPLPKGVAGLDRAGVMPFMHYSWKATPIFIKLMAKHPFKVAALHVAFAGFGASEIIGEQDERDKVTPDWMNNALNILGVDNYVEVNEGEYLNLGRAVPAMRFMNISPVSVYLGSDGGILANVMGIIFTGVDNKGYSVDGRTSDTAMQRFANRASALSEDISPPLFPAIPVIVRQKRDARGKEIKGETEVVSIGGRYFQKAYDAIGGKKDKRGNPLEVTDVIKQATGLKLQKIDKLMYAQKSVNKARKEFVRAYNMSKSSKKRSASLKAYKEELKKIKGQLPRKYINKLKIKTSTPGTSKKKKNLVFSKKQIIKL